MIHKGQRGITLVELLVAVAIVGLISAGIATLISQIITGSARDSDRMVLVRQVQQAGTEIHGDIMQAQWVMSDPNHEDGFPLSIWWEWDGAPTDVHYRLDGTDLMRRVDDEQERRVARYITSITIDPVPYPSQHEGGTLILTVTASFPWQDEEDGERRVYEVEPRSVQRNRPD